MKYEGVPGRHGFGKCYALNWEALSLQSMARKCDTE